MTKPILFLLWGAALASAWWSMGTGIVKTEVVFAPVFLVSLFGSIGTLCFIAMETIDNWKD